MDYLSDHLRKESVYIGDGAYVYDDTIHLWVFTTDGINITNKVALDPHVEKALLQILKARASNV